MECDCKVPSLVPFVSQMNSDHILFPCFFNFHLNITFQCTPRPFKLLNGNELSFTYRVKWLFSVTLILRGWSKDELKSIESLHLVAEKRQCNSEMIVSAVFVASEDPFVLIKAAVNVRRSVFSLSAACEICKTQAPAFPLLGWEIMGRNYAVYLLIRAEGAHRLSAV
jgi:hypothetical protein